MYGNRPQEVGSTAIIDLTNVRAERLVIILFVC